MEFKDDGWQTLKLDEIGEVVGGGTPSTKISEYYGGCIPWITPKDLSGYKSKYIFRGERNITEKGLKNSSAILLPKGSVLFSSRAPIGYIAIAGCDVATNQGFKSIIPNEEIISSDFLYYLLKYNVETIKNQGSGSTFSEISGKVMKSIEVSVPTRETQDVISMTLSSLDSKIELNNKIIANLEDQAQAIFKSWFIDFEPFQDGNFVESELGLIPEGWEIFKLSEKSSRFNGYIYKSNELIDESNINMLTIKNFNRYGGQPNETTKPIRESDRMREHHFLRSYDLLIACTDLTQAADIIGRVLLYVKSDLYEKEIFSMDLIKIIPNDKQNNLFIYYYLKSPTFKNYASSIATGTTVLHLPKKSVDDFVMIFPKKKEILKFTDTISPFIELQNSLSKENKTLAQIRDTLLPKLMSGEIDVSNITIDSEEDDHV